MLNNTQIEKIQKATMPSYVLVNINENERPNVFNIPELLNIYFGWKACNCK